MNDDFPITIENNALILTRRGMMEIMDRPPASYDEWLEFGKKLFAAKQAIQWAIGDWINYGESAYGEKYAQALSDTDISYQTLQNYAWLSKSFEASRRREGLSWSHHEAVVGIESIQEQDALLDIAESQQMGRDELRDVVKRYKQPGLLVIENENSSPRVIEGELIWDGFWVFVPDDAELHEGKAILHLYEDGE